MRCPGGCKACAAAHPEMKKSKPCASGLREDLGHESCERWCAEVHHDAHCAHCACKSCPFCVPKSALHEIQAQLEQEQQVCLL